MSFLAPQELRETAAVAQSVRAGQRVSVSFACGPALALSCLSVTDRRVGEREKGDMKMNWLLFFGCIVVLAGASLILKALFHIELPLVRSAVALLIVFVGLRMLTDAWFGERWIPGPDGTAVVRMEASGTRAKYDVVFAKNTIDLTSLRDLNHDVSVEVNAVFGSAEVLMPAGVSYDVEANAAFGAVQLPDRTAAGFGQQHSQRVVSSSPGRIRLKLSAVFGNCQLLEEPAPPANPAPPAEGRG